MIWSNKHDVFVEKSEALMSVYFEGVGETTAHEAQRGQEIGCVFVMPTVR